MFLENDEWKKDASNIGNWKKDNAPLFYLHVKYMNSTQKSSHLHLVQIRFHNNCENLGFNVYGNIEALYGIERFFTELVTFYDELFDEPVNKHHLRAFVRGSFMKLLGGEWFKSKSKTGDEQKFGLGWN